jgi:hypothetical protein
MARHVADTCEVVCEDNNKRVLADLLSFKEKAFLSVSLGKAVRLNLQWNGKVFEGKMGGRSFISNGPAVIETKSRF